MRTSLKTVLVHTPIFLWVAMCGCASMKHDITQNAAYTSTTDYVVGKEYCLKRPVFVQMIDAKPVLKQEGGQVGGLQGGPYSVEEYDKGDKSKWPEVVGVLRVGTRLKVKNLELERSFEMGNLVWIQAEVMDGGLVGRLVDLSFISKRKVQDIHNRPPASIPLVDPTFLEPVQSSPSP